MVRTEECDLYICTTPRHWLLASILVEKLGQPAIVAIVCSFPGAQELYEVLRDLKHPRLKKVILFPGKQTKNIRRFGFKSEWILQKKTWKKLLNSNNIARVFIANIHSRNIQYIHYLSQKNQKIIQFHILDDGLQTYHPEFRKQKSFISQLFASLQNGFPYLSLPNQKIFSFFSDIWLFQPNLVDKRFAHLSLHEIEKKDLNNCFVNGLRKSAFEKFGFDETRWQKASKIVFAFTKLNLLEETCPHFSLSRFQNRVKIFLESKKLIDSDHQIWVKYHPRELTDDPFKLDFRGYKVFNIPATLPFELLLSDLTSNDCVVGEQSSVLFDAAVICPDTSVISLDCATSHQAIHKLFRDANVEVRD